jgi:hypothetical protein
MTGDGEPVGQDAHRVGRFFRRTGQDAPCRE